MSRNPFGSITRGMALAVLAVAASVCLADGKHKRPPMDPQGEPGGLKKGVTECYKIWHGDGWHLHVVNGKGSRAHRYQGTITVDNGVFEGIRSSLAKKNDALAQWKRGPRKNELTFDFTTHEKEDGINFHVSKGATAVKFSLKIDGKELPDQIFVGKRGDNPESCTFSFAAHPGSKRAERVAGGEDETRAKK